MEFRWQSDLLGEPNKELIVVFNGWAIAPDVFDHLTGPYDILFASDYRDLDADLPDLSGYDRVSLVAWSFGVASYAHWQQGRSDPFDRKVAVNGTLAPVSRTTGVPSVAMDKTLQTLSVDAYQLFLMRVFNGRQPSGAIDVRARKDELRAIKARGDAPKIPFDRVWISTADKIFPAANQTRAWADNVTRQIDAPHAPFAAFTNWQEILS
jgi:biotin synthesis protein BioG